MTLHLKAVRDPYGDCDFVLFEEGQYATPLRIIPGYEMAKLVDEYTKGLQQVALLKGGGK